MYLDEMLMDNYLLTKENEIYLCAYQPIISHILTFFCYLIIYIYLAFNIFTFGYHNFKYYLKLFFYEQKFTWDIIDDAWYVQSECK